MIAIKNVFFGIVLCWFLASGTLAQTTKPQPQTPAIPEAPATPTENSDSLAENVYFGINLGLMFLPVGFDGGYNFKDFGIRVSLDTEYAGLEGYARFRLGEDLSYWYAGGGVGYSILGASNLFGSRTSFVDPPFGINGLIGLQFAVGFFAEYQPFLLFGAFKNDSSASIALLAGIVHVKIGWRFFF